PVLITLEPAGLREPERIEPLLACATQRRLAIVVRLDLPVEWQHAPDPYAAIAEWITPLEAFLQGNANRVRRFELGRRPELQFDPESYAFLVEKVSTLIRSFDPDALVILGPLGEGAGAWLDRIDPRRLAPYIDTLSLEDPVDLPAWLARLARDYPSTSVWLHQDRAVAGAYERLERYHGARSAGVETFFIAQDPPEADAATQVALNLMSLLPSRFLADEGPGPGSLGFGDPLGPERAVVVLDPARRPAGAPLDLGSDPVGNLRADDLTTGSPMTAPIVHHATDGGPFSIEVSPSPAGPFLVRYLVMKGPRGAAETVGVTDDYQMTAEEIIAKERAFETAQARAVDHYEARASISYHYRAETLGESIDVTSVNRFFWKAGVGEYQETDLFINGARWKGKPPSLPFIQAEKVKEVPLAIRLDETYRYRLKGTDTVEGHPAYEIEFEPVASEGSRHSGEIWIDKVSFARLKIRLVQHGLKEPITSNTDVIEYGPVPAGADPPGAAWLPVRAYRQMVFTVLGRAVAAERRVLFEGFSLNSEAFERGREEAYATGHPILRDDENGYSYVIKDADGFRTAPAESLRNIAFFGGIGIDSSGHLGTPFGGINYFNFNWRNTGTQLDVAFAGPLIDIAWTDPKLGASRWEFTADGRFVGLSETFHRTTAAGRVEEEDVKLLEEHGLLSLARPLTPFQKVVLQGEIFYDAYRGSRGTNLSDPIGTGSTKTRVRLPDFVPPPAGLTTVATTRWNYHRNGYLLDLWYSAGHRLRWDDWGIPVPVTPPTDPSAPIGPTVLVGGRSDDTDFRRGGLTLLKSLYPTKLQTISFGLSLFDGAGLDRFSRFRIGDFRNARVRGFNGRDITFDRGATTQLNYKFTLPRGGASVELGVERVVFDNEEDFGGREYVAGGGAAVSIKGPWSTLLSFRGSFGLGSSIEEVGSSGSGIRIVMIKTMDHWPHRRHATR
ncbi:MAG TPA: hypothetical protein VFE84_10980, partial [Patescibacteria group bacterium]|nr:hypothetical protein [Patescibacteria group bacterium]